MNFICSFAIVFLMYHIYMSIAIVFIVYHYFIDKVNIINNDTLIISWAPLIEFAWIVSVIGITIITFQINIFIFMILLVLFKLASLLISKYVSNPISLSIIMLFIETGFMTTLFTIYYKFGYHKLFFIV